jgi:hypothetical protein
MQGKIMEKKKNCLFFMIFLFFPLLLLVCWFSACQPVLTVEIIEPEYGATFTQNENITFKAKIINKRIQKIKVIWISSIDKEIHTEVINFEGESKFTTSSLSPGEHNIYSNVYDLEKDDRVGQDVIFVMINEKVEEGDEEEEGNDDNSIGDGTSEFDDCYAIPDIEISASEPKYTEVDGTVNSCVSKIIVKNNSDKTIYCYWLVEPEGDYSIDWGGWQYAFVYSGEEQEHYNPTWGCNSIISGNPKCYSASIATAFYAVPECSWIGELFTQYAYEPQPDDLDDLNIRYIFISGLNPCF